MDISKLPKWAQREIEQLELKIAKLESVIDVEAKEPTRVSGAASYDAPRIYLPNFQPVRFEVGPIDVRHPDWIDVRIRNGDPKGVEIMGSSSIAIEPKAGNHVRVSIA